MPPFFAFIRQKAILYGETYRFLVVHSNKLDARKVKSIQAHLEKKNGIDGKKEKEKLEKLRFACESDAQVDLSAFLKSYRGSHTFQGYLVREELPGKRTNRGRPKKGESPSSTKTVYRSQLDLQPPSEEQKEELHQQTSSFILITNSTKEPTLSDVELLKVYRGQQTVENRFRFLKSPYFVGRVCLKNPRRVEAFAYVMMLSWYITYSNISYVSR